MTRCLQCKSDRRGRKLCIVKHNPDMGFHTPTRCCIFCDDAWHDIVIPDKRPPMPQNFEWYSVCSAHGEYNPECNCCNAGHWVNNELHEFESWLYKENKTLWQKWANRETTPEQSGHGARHFLEKIFPGLRS